MSNTKKREINKSNFRFSAPHISNFYFDENKDFDEFYLNHNEQTNELLDAHPTFELEIKKNYNECSAYVVLTLKINVDDDRAVVPYKLVISTAAIFEWDNKLSDKVDKMLQLNAPALLLSYMRPIVSLITSVSRFPQYDIPFINFAEQKIIKKE